MFIIKAPAYCEFTHGTQEILKCVLVKGKYVFFPYLLGLTQMYISCFLHEKAALDFINLAARCMGMAVFFMGSLHIRNKRYNGRQMSSLFILTDSPFNFCNK